MCGMTDQSTITIIVPVYKAEATIGRCVDSILAQTYPDWRLILVDDGSPDRSGDLCDEYAAADPRIRAVHIPNGGAGNARNQGLNVCDTKWVTFVDADDSIEPGYLANFHLKEHLDESDVIIMQGYRRVQPNLTLLEERVDLKAAQYSGNDFLEEAFASDCIFEYGQVVGKVYLAEIIRNNNIHFSSSFHISEDHVFYLTYLLYTKRVVTYRGTLYNYIWEENCDSLSRRHHPYRELYCRYEAVFIACERLEARCGFNRRNVLEKIRYFAVTESISLLLRGLYETETEKTRRVEMLKQILFERERINTSFKPHSVQGQLLRFCMLHLPVRLADSLLWRAFKFNQGKN